MNRKPPIFPSALPRLLVSGAMSLAACAFPAAPAQTGTAKAPALPSARIVGDTPAPASPNPPAAPQTAAKSPEAQALRDAIAKNDEPGAFAAALKGAEKKDPECLLLLGRMHEGGRGTTKDLAKAADAYRRAADAGSVDGMAIYARCLETGSGVRQDLDKGAFYWMKAAEGGLATAQTLAGLSAEKGNGRPVDLAEARTWYEKSAAQNDPGALWRLSTFYAEGKAGLTKDVTKAVDFCFQAAQRGNLEAMNQMGLHYRVGSAGRQDPVAGAGWFSIAAEYGNADAQTNLGQCYEAGIGVRTNPGVAARLYNDAANQNHPVGQFCLAQLYEAGKGVAADPEKAYVFFSKSAANGYTPATARRDAVKARLTPAQLTEADKALAHKAPEPAPQKR